VFVHRALIPKLVELRSDKYDLWNYEQNRESSLRMPRLTGSTPSRPCSRVGGFVAVLACIPREDPDLVVVVGQAVVRIGQGCKGIAGLASAHSLTLLMLLAGMLSRAMNATRRWPSAYCAMSSGAVHGDHARQHPSHAAEAVAHRPVFEGRRGRSVGSRPDRVRFRRAWLGGNRCGGLLIRGRPLGTYKCSVSHGRE
jgi:hypothetical protein